MSTSGMHRRPFVGGHLVSQNSPLISGQCHVSKFMKHLIVQIDSRSICHLSSSSVTVGYLERKLLKYGISIIPL